MWGVQIVKTACPCTGIAGENHVLGFFMLRAVYRRLVQAAGLPDSQARQCLSELEAGLTAHTYHED